MTDIAGPVRRELLRQPSRGAPTRLSATPPQHRDARRVTVRHDGLTQAPAATIGPRCGKASLGHGQSQSYCSQKAARPACGRDGGPMKTRILGRTGRAVSVIGLGTWQLGADWGEIEDSAALAVLAAAAESGVTFLDT